MTRRAGWVEELWSIETWVGDMRGCHLGAIGWQWQGSQVRVEYNLCSEKLRVLSAKGTKFNTCEEFNFPTLCLLVGMGLILMLIQFLGKCLSQH